MRGLMIARSGRANRRTPMRRMRLGCWARAASGQLAADPATALMKSRRRIALPWVRTGLQRCDYISNLRPGKWDFISEQQSARGCSLWVNRVDFSLFARRPLYPQYRPQSGHAAKSEKCQKLPSQQTAPLFDYLVG